MTQPSSPAPRRRIPTWGYALGVALAVVVVWVVIALASSAGTKGSDAGQTSPNNGTQQLHQQPQSDKLGGRRGGGE